MTVERPLVPAWGRKQWIGIFPGGWAAVMVCSYAPWIPSVHAQVITRVSVATGGGQANGNSAAPSISADGRYVAFSSFASNLVPGDTNSKWDIFVYDLQTRQPTRVSIATGGQQARESCEDPVISADGRYVAFTSFASELVLGDTNGKSDIFVHDRQTVQTTRVNVGYQGAQAFGGNSSSPAINADGRYVAFASEAIDLLVDAGDSNGVSDIFVHDRQTRQTSRVSIATGGGQADGPSRFPAISADGRYVAFASWAKNLGGGGVYVHDRQTGQTSSVIASGTATTYRPAISADGRYVAYSDEDFQNNDGRRNIFVHDRQTRQTTRMSVASDGGRANGQSYQPVISGNGQYVAFDSEASNLVSGDTNGLVDAFVRDRQTQQTVRINPAKANGVSGHATISADGRFIAFQSNATNLISGDTNGMTDIFVRVPLSMPLAPTDPQRR